MANTAMPWVKLYTEFIDDTKIARLPKSAQLLFVKLLCIAGQCDAEGYLANGDDVMTSEVIAWRLHDDPAEVEHDLQTLIGCGAVAIDEHTQAIHLPNFTKRQGRSQSGKREQWRERQAKARDRSKGVTRESRVSHAPREEKRREEEEESASTTHDVPPNGSVAAELQAAAALALNSPQVRLWRSKVCRPISQHAAIAIYEQAKDVTAWGEVLDMYLSRPDWNADNVHNQLSIYKDWNTDVRNPRNRNGRNGQPAQPATPATPPAEVMAVTGGRRIMGYEPQPDGSMLPIYEGAA